MTRVRAHTYMFYGKCQAENEKKNSDDTQTDILIENINLLTHHFEHQFYINYLKYYKILINVYHLNLYINEDFVHDLHQIYKIELQYSIHPLVVVMYYYYY
jgi:hypothetical protein